MSKLALLALLFATNALADSFLTIPAVSLHGERGRGYNEMNFGVGIEHELDERWRVGAGTYRNSIRKDSYYAGAIYSPWSVYGVKIGTSLGIVTGYGNALPMLAPTLMYEGKEYGLNLVIVPPVVAKGGVLGFQLKRRL